MSVGDLSKLYHTGRVHRHGTLRDALVIASRHPTARVPRRQDVAGDAPRGLSVIAFHTSKAIDVIATESFGYMKLTSLPRVGGHCVARGPFCLACKPERLNNTARFIELPDQVTSARLGYWGQRVRDAFNDAGKALEGSSAPVLRMAHMPQTERIGELFALACACLLQEKGARMPYHDPYLAALAYDVT